VHVRTRAGVPSPIPVIRDDLNRVDPNLVMRNVETVADARRKDTASTRFLFSLVAIFAGVAVMLVGVGLYGVVAYLASRRTREIGIRIALGARRASVTKMVLQQGLRPTFLGIVVGLILSIRGGEYMEALLFDVRPANPFVLTGVSVLVLLVASLAMLVPARRATRIDPTEALRAE
jgi:putative ABC transport system permease protein